MIEEKMLDMATVIDENKERFEYAIWEVGSIWLIDYYSKSSVGWHAFDNLDEARAEWCVIKDILPEEATF